MKKENKMQKENTISVELNAQHIAMLLGALFEANNAGLICPEDYKLFAQTQELIERAENSIYA
jgi:hypothetical protein